MVEQETEGVSVIPINIRIIIMIVTGKVLMFLRVFVVILNHNPNTERLPPNTINIKQLFCYETIILLCGSSLCFFLSNNKIVVLFPSRID